MKIFLRVEKTERLRKKIKEKEKERKPHSAHIACKITFTM